MSTIKTKMILRRGVSWQLPGHPRTYGRGDVTQLETGTNGIPDIFFTDTTDSLIVEPLTTHVSFTKPLDEGEMAFTTDEGRLFIGGNNERGLPQRYRLKYPYQNIEVVAENSTKAFADLHGHRMKNGNANNFHNAPLHTTDRMPSTTTPQLVAENLPGFMSNGVATNNLPTLGVGSPPIRDISATSSLLMSKSPTTSSTNEMVVVDTSIDKCAYYNSVTSGSNKSYLLTVRSISGGATRSIPIAHTDGIPDFKPSAFKANGDVVGVQKTESKSGIRIYKTDGSVVNLKVITHGMYDPALDRTRITSSYYAPKEYSKKLGMVSVEGVAYVNLGIDFTIGVAGNFIVVSCTSVLGEATDPSCFIIFDDSGEFVTSVKMPPQYVGQKVSRWSKVGSHALAEVRLSVSPSKIHGLLFNVQSPIPSMEVLTLHDYAQQALASYGSPTLKHYFCDNNDNSIVLFMAVNSVGEKGDYYIVAKWSFVTRAIVWVSKRSVLIPRVAPPALTDQTWRPPVSVSLCDSVSRTYKWLTDIGFHELDLVSGAIRSAAWSETEISPIYKLDDFQAYNSSTGKILFGGLRQNSISYDVYNNSVDSSGDYRFSEFADGYYQGGSEDANVLTTLTSSNGFNEFIVNVAVNSVAVYRASDLKFVAGWDGGRTVSCGGAAVPCSNGVTLVPLTNGAILQVSSSDTGVVTFAIIPLLDGTEGQFGKMGIYFHDISDNSLIVLGGPVNTTTNRSFKWSISNRSFIWSRTFSNPLNADDIDGGCPTAPALATRMVRSGLYAFMNKAGGLSLIRLSTGERLLSTSVSAPWGNGQWEWETATNTLLYLNTRQQFSTDMGASIKDQIINFNGDEPYLKGQYKSLELFKIRFNNSNGSWSTDVSSLASDELLPPDMRLWVDYKNRNAYYGTNGILKCVNIDSLDVVSKIETAVGQGFVKLAGSTTAGKLFLQYGSHNNNLAYDPVASTDLLFTPMHSFDLLDKASEYQSGVYWRTIHYGGNEYAPVEIKDIRTSVMFVDYMVNDQNGIPIRSGRLELQYFHNPFADLGQPSSDSYVSVVDETDSIRNADTKIFDPTLAFGDVGFRFVVRSPETSPKLAFQYRNLTGQKLWISWKVSRP